MSDGVDWTANGPRSRRFDDIYFSPDDGLAESRLVFLEGCGLPEAWRGRKRFVVGELGFGAGLNALALIDLWRRERLAGGQLHLFSAEAFPLSREEAAEALAAWPELGEVASELLDGWPDGRCGFHRIELPRWGVIIDLAIQEVEPALRAWGGRADAWFLDGFAPSRNPGMWTPEVLSLVAARSAPGAQAATYTVAGAVRRGLEAAGFSLERRPGFGRKRERLEARLAGDADQAISPSPAPPKRVAIVGGGIAGAALARAFSALGVHPTLIEAAAPGAGASGNPAALVAPWLDASLGAAARLHAQAFARAVDLYRRETPEAVIARGALQLARRERDAARFAAVCAWDGFAPPALTSADSDAASLLLGEPAPEALILRDALTVEPLAVLADWSGGADRIEASVASIKRAASGWRLCAQDGSVITDADVVCVACSLASATLANLPPLRSVRGQASWADIEPRPHAAAWGGYAIPTRTGVLFGTTHDRGDLDCAPRAEDDARNLRTLGEGRPRLAERLTGAALGSRAGTRATTPDHLPLAGAVAGSEGLFVLCGLGGRGFTLAPLLAEHIAAEALGAPSPLPADLAPLVAPDRFEPKIPRGP